MKILGQISDRQLFNKNKCCTRMRLINSAGVGCGVILWNTMGDFGVQESSLIEGLSVKCVACGKPMDRFGI